MQFVQDHLREDPAQLLLAYAGKTSFDLKAAVQQIQARQKAQHKIPSWFVDSQLIFPVSLSMEQASSEETALFKSGLVEGKTMIDLTGGLGIDSYFLSKKFEKATYCEQQPELFEISKHNLEHLSPGKFNFQQGDSMAFLQESQETFDLIFVDPARRGSQQQKLYKLADCGPDVVLSWPLMKAKAKTILIKASPMLDIKIALEEIPDIQKVWVLSVKNEVKEILLYCSALENNCPVKIEAVELKPDRTIAFPFYLEEEAESTNVFGLQGKFLVEPFSSILKAGAFKTFGARYGLFKLHPNTHLYCSTQMPEEVAGRIFEILEEVRQPKKDIKRLFPNGKVNVLTRNYALSADELKKKYKLKDGGEFFLIGAKVENDFKLWKCRLLSN